ncbi:phosphodiesterase [Corynebacterium sp. sy017]|uniref:metallophosphoesterase n=1 Tax=unclassified Corynebacterium TaxID=2624378 RepID=UPI001184DAA0|nr:MULTISPECIES: metallophosphoesterase [unclassified Corynebacterium]MBP3088495.1 phosphodiesterase [Corynebacterium sp. sy017]QDZ41916.1 phosphodiesterase [Corynebacterium sp. sy039]TSD91800.1 phosphodiesterase [Corynebacterium sp. SY003]
MSFTSAEHPAPEHFLVHFSDTHFLAPHTTTLHGVARYYDHLAQLLESVAEYAIAPEALIFSGDLTDHGEEHAYASLRALVEPVAQRMGARVIWIMGNHDDRTNFRHMLLDEQPSNPLAPCDSVHWLGGLRIIALDTSVPGQHYGELSDAQLEWLATELRSTAPEGTILAMHHPPIPCIQAQARSVELRGQHRLKEVIYGSDIRSILAGHVHYSTFATFADIPVSVSMGTCYTQDLLTPKRGTRGRDAGQGMHFVHVYPDTIMHSVVQQPGGETVGRFVPGDATQ